MRRLCHFAAFAAVAILAVSLTASRGVEPAQGKSEAKLPNIPGEFQGYNVTGRFKGHYHSHISEYGMEPMVMIVTHEVAFSDPLKALLKQIDDAIEKNPAARLHAFVVVLSDDVPDVVGADDKSDDKRIEVTATGRSGQSPDAQTHRRRPGRQERFAEIQRRRRQFRVLPLPEGQGDGQPRLEDRRKTHRRRDDGNHENSGAESRRVRK